jgi:NitT/TauT family transport system permease protein
LIIFHTAWTTFEAVAGFGLGMGIGTILAIVMGLYKPVERILYPYAIILRAVPSAAIAPLLVLWLGFNIYPIIVTAAIVCFFSAVVNGITGIRSISKETRYLMHSLDASKWQVFRYVQSYAMLPYFFSAMKIASVLAIIGAVIGEFVGTTQGLGYVVMVASRYAQTVRVFEALVLLSAEGVGFFGIISLLEAHFLKWKE